LAGVLRFTLVATSNRFTLSLDASGAGSTITLGGTNHVLGAGGGLAVQAEFPSTTPYLGFGRGRHGARGLRFASISAQASARPSSR